MVKDGLYVYSYKNDKELWEFALMSSVPFYVVRGSFVAAMGVSDDWACYYDEDMTTYEIIENGRKVPHDIAAWAFPEISAKRVWRQ